MTEIGAGRERASRRGKISPERRKNSDGPAAAAGPRMTCPRIARTVCSARRPHGPAGPPPRGAASAVRRETRIALPPPGPAADESQRSRGAGWRHEEAARGRDDDSGGPDRQGRTRDVDARARARRPFGRSIAGRPASEAQLAVPRWQLALLARRFGP